ncbi:MAG: hypothetical protein HN981_04980 [Candidatus Pacebacteria bacterium]|jgi:deoxyadenosine/deoxycytidine kinase|nr:hypothetical protein [Candidatus Paceibacterota bacterium]MBT4652350.1 hypothetical protein [Candidatus Paceibacterota bacterium]MBT6756177.1 hypothetical protein [Candidatus Paceibacterota bacterium]MBT6921718.1 hypothetical protein [Candidatus Paceibacterota bacterium]
MSEQKIINTVGVEGALGVGKTTLIWKLFDPDAEKKDDFLPTGVGKDIALVGESRDLTRQITPPRSIYPAFKNKQETLDWNKYFLDVEMLKKTIATDLAKSGLPVVFDRTIFSVVLIRRALDLLNRSLFTEYDHVIKIYADALEKDEIILPPRMMILTAGIDTIMDRLSLRGTSTSIFKDHLFLTKLLEFYKNLAGVYTEDDSVINLSTEEGIDTLPGLVDQAKAFLLKKSVSVSSNKQWFELITQIELLTGEK